MDRKSTEETNNGYDPLSDAECEEVVGELAKLPDDAERAGLLNSYGCDCYHAGQLDILVNGPTSPTGKTMTKAEALAWLERIYA